MADKWRPYMSEDCPVCSWELEVYATYGDFTDGDPVKCTECGYQTTLSVDEDGDMWLQVNLDHEE